MLPDELIERQRRLAKTVVKPLYFLFAALAVVAFKTGSVFGLPPKVLPAVLLLGLPIIGARAIMDAMKFGLIWARSGVVDRGSQPIAFIFYLALWSTVSIGTLGAFVFIVILLIRQGGSA